MARDLTRPDPAGILELITAFRRSKVLFDSVALGVFDALSNGPRPLAWLADRLRADADALERLLDACVGLGLLSRTPEGYGNTPAASAYLCRESPERLTGYINYSNEVMWSMWAHLKDAVRAGTHRWKQAFGWDGNIFSHLYHTEDARREFLMGMHGFGLISSPHVVSAFDLGRFGRLVDLGGATGHLAIAACRRYPQLEAVLFDLPEVLPLAKEIIGGSPAAGRIRLVEGDFFSDPLPEGDLYSLGRILHDWSEQKILLLLGRIYQRLPAGGALLVAEKLLDDDKRGPSWAQMQSLNMLVCAEGKERTLAEYESLLARAGFAEVCACRTASPLDAILAVKNKS